MNLNERRCIVSKSVDLKNNFKSPLQRRYLDFPVCGGSFSDFELAWLYNGPLLRIFDITNGAIVSAWDFSVVTHDDQTEITSIIEYFLPESVNRNSSRESQLYFIVSYTSRKDSSRTSFISLCHPRTSRILHTITTEERVTYLSLISAKKNHSSPITGIVKAMCGALAVGTTSGNLLIMDIREIFSSARQGCSDRVCNRFSELIIVDHKHNESSVKEKLNRADEFHHIALSLSVSDRKDPQGSDLTITALMYIPQCTMLAVGLGNGVFQLWDVSTLKRLYRSSLAGIPLPVVKFGFQEPCNDPQSFCYLWVLYESRSKQNECLPFAVMYACLFKKISTAPEYGVHYKNFVHCKKRFDLDVDLDRCVNGRCIACSVVSNTPSNILRHVTFAEEETSKINLFVIVFETWEQITDNNSCLTLIIFDMNQWYKAQLPQTAYQGGTASFVSFLSLERISERKNSVVDVRIRKDTIQQFLSFNLSEEYTYPSSLSCDALVITDTKLIHAQILGAQRNILDKIVSEGPSGIINPNKFFSECKEAGLWPCFSNTFSHVIVPNQVQQRNFILTVLLEHKFSSFLVQCAKQWADGSRGVSGCTLPNLVKWAWDCVTRIKQLTDTVCIPLFDYSGDDLDRENYQKLKHCVQLMRTIKDFLAYIYKNYKQYLLEDVKLKCQLDALKLITKYFDIIIWCLDCSLLPEKVTSSSEKCVPTYMMNLMQFTEQRRDELRKIVIKDQYFVTANTTLFIIDSILEQDSNGKKIQLQWERESGGLSNGLYPPVTLQSLLRMFLVPGLSDDAKNFIMIYFLLDVCDYHRDEDMKQQLLSFAVVFSIDSAFFSLVQACWFIDHEKFEDAAGLLLSESTISQLKNRRELYRTLLLSCICQGQYQLALRIERLMKLSRTVFNDDTFYVTLLLLNGLVMDAYLTIRDNTFNQKGLLRHFFKVCDNLGYLKEVFKFPLSPKEEEEFMTYLDSCDNKDAGDLKVMYLLSRGKYVEAIDVNHQLSSIVPKFNIVGQDTTKQKTGVGRTTTRDLLVNAFSKTLPAVTNDLINFCRKEKNKIARFKAVSKPTPLSVVVHTDTSQQVPIYKSSFESVVEAAICKTAETWANVPEILRQKRGHLSVKNTPFLRSNLITPRKNNSVFFKREGFPVTDEKNKNIDVVDEPPMKRIRKSIFVSEDNNVDESTPSDESIMLSTSAETNQLLSTPHVQKRLNKLLLNTPESSPLTSILKSAESRFRQPQKVGFSVPEADVRRSKRISATLCTPIPEKTEGKSARKSVEIITEHRPLENRVSPQRMDTSVDELVNESIASTVQDSFYSLDSDSDEALGLTDFIQETSTFAHSSKLMVESMREDQPSYSHTSSKLIIESMSEEDTPKSGRISNLIIETMSEEKTSQFGRSTLIIENMSEGEISQSDRTSDLTPRTGNVKEKSPSNRALEFIDESVSKTETSVPTCLQVESRSRNVQVDIHSSPSGADTICAIEIAEAETRPSSLVTEGDTVSFAALQPVENAFTRDQTDHVDKTYSETSLLEDFSIDTYEKETIVEQDSQEITSTNSEDDSDIEIVEESSPSKHLEIENVDDAATEVNENLSDGSYETDDSYSQDSVRTDSEAEEEDLQVEDEDSSIEESFSVDGDDIEEEEEEEEEERGEEANYEEEEECLDDEEDLGDNEENEGKEDDEEEEIKIEDINYVSFSEITDQDQDINYESLKTIINAVNEAESKKTEISNADTDLPSTDPSPSSLPNESTASVYEIMDIDSPTVRQIEETQENSPSKTIDVSVVESVNQSLDTSMEISSVSGVDKEKTEKEPEMFFFFGADSSVTSISEKLLSDESMNERQLDMSKNVAETSQKTRDDSFSLDVANEENMEKSIVGGNNEIQVSSSCANVNKKNSSNITRRREDSSFFEIEEHVYDIEETNKSADVSSVECKQISSQERSLLTDKVSGDVPEKIQDPSVVIEKRGKEADSSDDKIDEPVEVEKSFYHLQDVSSEKVEMPSDDEGYKAGDDSITAVTQEPGKSILSGEELIKTEELGKELSPSDTKEAAGKTISSKENIDKSYNLRKSERKSVQSYDVSIGLVEEMVGDVTQETGDIVNVTVSSCRSMKESKIDKSSNPMEEIIASNESRSHLSIDVAEEVVGSTSSRLEDFSVLERTRKLRADSRGENSSSTKTTAKDILISESVEAENSDPILSSIKRSVDPIKEAPVLRLRSSNNPNQKKSIEIEISESNQDVITLSSNSDEKITTDNRSPVEKLTPEHDIVSGESNPVPTASRIEKTESERSPITTNPDLPMASVVPQIEKTESVHSDSIDLSVQDSPTPVDSGSPSPVPDTTPSASRRSARIARRSSTDDTPRQVVSEPSTPISTRASRKRSIDSVEAASVQSDASAAESLASRASKSSARQRTSRRLELKKSSVKPSLGTIHSDEESNALDDDRSSVVSETSSRRSTRHSLNTALLLTPSPPPKKRIAREFQNIASGMAVKTEKETENHHAYTDSRRLTRNQKLLLQNADLVVPKLMDTASGVDAQVDSSIGKMKRPIVHTQASTRPWKEKLEERDSARSTRSSKSLKRDIPQTDSDSSDESIHSKASTASRRSRPTGTRIGLRKSSVRPPLKKLSVIPSDEESLSQTITEDEPPTVRTTRGKKQTQKNESEHSDAESIQSNLSESATATPVRRTRRSIALEGLSKTTPVSSQKSVQTQGKMNESRKASKESSKK